MEKLSTYIKDLLINKALYMRTIIYSKILYDIITKYFKIDIQNEYYLIFEDKLFKPVFTSILYLFLIYFFIKLFFYIIYILSDYLGRKILNFEPKFSIYFFQKKKLINLMLANYKKEENRKVSEIVFLIFSFVIYLNSLYNFYCIIIILIVTYFLINIIYSYNSFVVDYIIENYDTEKNVWKNLSEKEINENKIHI